MAWQSLHTTELKTKRLYFIGILGSGMLPLAELCRSLGLNVTGSDNKVAEAAQFKVNPQNGEHLKADDIVIYSTAIRASNPDRSQAKTLGATELHRYELLMLLLKECSRAIAVSGTHGKTSTTTMVAEMLARYDLNPGYFAGGSAIYFGGGSKTPVTDTDVTRLTHYPFAYEADESDGSFLKSDAAYRIITNIDADHLENYGGSFENLLEAFFDFGKAAKHLVVCGDDNNVKILLPRWQAAGVSVYSYGYEKFNDLVIHTQDGYTSKFTLKHKSLTDGTKSLTVQLPMPAPHYHRNFAAAIYIGLLFQIPLEAIGKIIAGYRGVARRLQHYGNFVYKNISVSLYDDYGHHPTEMEAVITSLQQSKNFVCVLFQPHRFTRTQALASQFAQALELANEVVLLPIYSAGEDAIDGVSHHSIAEHFSDKNKLAVKDGDWTTSDWTDLLDKLATKESNAIVLTLGAGDVFEIIASLPENPFRL